MLDTFETIKICTSYLIDGKEIRDLPDTVGQEKAVPVYEEYQGWLCDTSSARNGKVFPENAQNLSIELPN